MPIAISISVFLVAVIAMVVILVKLTSCVHAWELVDKTEFPPAIEAYKAAGGSILHYGYLSNVAVERMSKKTVILAMRCPKCGAAKIYKESA